MNKKIFFLFFVFCISFINVSASEESNTNKSVEHPRYYANSLIVKVGEDFSLTFNVENGEITAWTLPEQYEDLTVEEFFRLLIACSADIFGKNSERYELNEKKFNALIEDLKNQNKLGLTMNEFMGF